MDWKYIKDNNFPKEDKQQYLCAIVSTTSQPYYKICRWAKDLYKVDDYDFRDKKGKSGFYSYDGEWGFCEESDIFAWCEIDKPNYNQSSKIKKF